MRRVDRALKWFLVLYVGAFVLISSVAAIGEFQRLQRQSPQPWVTGDWLINYEGGFVRRGLVGQILLEISQVWGVPVEYCAMGLQLLLFGTYVFFLSFLAAVSESRVFAALVLVSPMTVQFHFLDPAGGFRKELLILNLLLLILVVAHQLRIRRASMKLRTLVLSLIYVLGTIVVGLSYETVLFLSVLLLWSTLRALQPLRDSRLQALTLVIVGLIINILILFVGLLTKASPSKVSAICESVAENGNNRICAGGISALGWELSLFRDVVSERMENQNGLFLVLLGLLLGMLPLFFVRVSKRFIAVLLVSFISFIPLYAVAVDWGRWSALFVASVLILALEEPALKHENRSFLGKYATRIGALSVVPGSLLYSINASSGQVGFHPILGRVLHQIVTLVGFG